MVLKADADLRAIEFFLDFINNSHHLRDIGITLINKTFKIAMHRKEQTNFLGMKPTKIVGQSMLNTIRQQIKEPLVIRKALNTNHLNWPFRMLGKIFFNMAKNNLSGVTLEYGPLDRKRKVYRYHQIELLQESSAR